MLRGYRDAQIIIIDKDIETVGRNVCRVFQLPWNPYSKQIKDGIEHRRYDNRIEIIGADLMGLDLISIL